MSIVSISHLIAGFTSTEEYVSADGRGRGLTYSPQLQDVAIVEGFPECSFLLFVVLSQLCARVYFISARI